MHNAETSQGVSRVAVGFLASKYARKDAASTKMTYLPPIHTAITEYWTLLNIFEISQKFSKQGNMRYTHITLDVGAAIKAFHVVWNNKDQWSNIIHLEIFMLSWHSLVVSGNSWPAVSSRRSFIKLVYAHLDQWMGCYLENIHFQVFLRRYFPGRYFMFFFRCWWVHKTFCGALERLFTKKFMSTKASNIISELKIDTVLQNLNNPKVQEVQRRSIQIKSKGVKWWSW